MNGRQALKDSSDLLSREVNSRIIDHIDSFLRVPEYINRINSDYIKTNNLFLTQRRLSRHFYKQLTIFPSVSSIYFANVHGGLADAGKELDGKIKYYIETDNFRKGTFRKFRVDDNGNVLDTILTVPHFDGSTRPWYKKAVEKNTIVWNDPYVLFTGDDLAISCSMPVYSNSSKLLGVTSVDISLSNIDSYIDSLIITPNGLSMVIDSNGIIVASSSKIQKFKKENSKFIRVTIEDSENYLIQSMAKYFKIHGINIQEIDNIIQFQSNEEKYFASFLKIDRPGVPEWYSVTIIPEGDVLSKIKTYNKKAIYFTVIVILLSIISIILIVSVITKPIKQLLRAFASASEENLVILENNDFIKETSSLKEEFNAVSTKLVQSIKNLKVENAEKEKARRAFQESEKRYKDLIDFAVGGILIGDSNGCIIDANSQICNLMKCSREYLLGRHITEKIFTEDSMKTNPFRFDLLKKGLIVENERVLQCVNGDRIPIEMHTKLMPDNTYQTIIHDITERKKVERQFQEEKERLSVTLNSIGDGVIRTDLEGNIITINKTGQLITGWTQEDAEGCKVSEVIVEVDDFNSSITTLPIEKVIETGEKYDLEDNITIISKTGVKIVISESASPIKNSENEIIGAVIVFRDVTERLKMLEQIHRTDKLESLGLLAGGIAHDFNNLLTGIFGYITLGKLSIESNDVKSALQNLEHASGALNRAENLTQQLLTFAKGGKPIMKYGDIITVLKKSISFALSGSNIIADYNFRTDHKIVKFDEGQISQVFDNIVINAKQAMPDGGKIIINVDCFSLTDDLDALLTRGNYLLISIQDTGNGISKELLSKIFDPFFSTKKSGNGLGLTTSFSIIKKHNGKLEAESKVGEGTVFKIFLPVAGQDEIVLDETQMIRHKGSGTIAILDDELYNRNVLGEMVKELGYSSVLASDGAELLTLLKDYSNISAFILDLTVPDGRGGKEIVADIKKIFPNSVFIAFSGYSSDQIISDPEKFGFTASLSKPFTLERLSKLFNMYLK